MTAWLHTLSWGCPGTKASWCCWTAGVILPRASWYSALPKLGMRKPGSLRWSHGQHRGLVSSRLLAGTREAHSYLGERGPGGAGPGKPKSLSWSPEMGRPRMQPVVSVGYGP